MKKYLLLLLLCLIFGKDVYEEIINEKVSEQYCNNVIGNMTALINDSYIFLDFLKAPKKSRPDYFTKMNLIEELNDINRTNRTFYDFYGDIQNVLGKTEDSHFLFYATKTPNNISLYDNYFCIPFYYYVYEIFDEDNITVKETYLTINPYNNDCQHKYSKETLNKINELAGKKIISINNLNPFVYLEKIGKNGLMTYSHQSRFIDALEYIMKHPLSLYPHKKEDLSISIQFEGEDELFETEYVLENVNNLNDEFKGLYLDEQKKYFKDNINIHKLEEIETQFTNKKGFVGGLKDEKDIWDLKNKDGSIRCRVDEENQFNVLYQSSFLTDNFTEYEDVMCECFTKFYSNNFKIIIIESRNGGGYTELCFPFTYFLSPKITNPLKWSLKSTELILKNFFVSDENLNPETCFPYTEKDDFLNGYQDTYDDGIDKVIHKRTKSVEFLNIFEKKIMEKKRKKYLDTGNTKKPTEILIFTDGYLFNCASAFIKGIQVHGHGILVGYNARPDLNKSDFDASFSDSGIEMFEISEYFQNLKELGFISHITFSEEFDPNDKGNPKIPMDFLNYPVDEISPIYKLYDDGIYNRFINESKRIFKKYNDLENGECNPDNKFLYYETSDCDSKINISKAHGGYICGDDRKWDKNNCIPAYCDEGYYLNDNRTECIKNPCDNIKLNEIIINEENSKEFIIKPNNTYIFTIEKENYSYYFYSKLEPFIYVLNDHHILESVKNGTKFNNKDKIYINYYVNITEEIHITVKVENDGKENDDKDKNKKKEEKEGLSTGIIVLIVVGSLIGLSIIILIIFILISKKKKITNEEIEEKSEQLSPIP